MLKSDEKYQDYVKILEEELIPAMGCTEPIAIAYAGAVARETLGCLPDELDIQVSGNIIKNVKSVIVPNTGGMRGIAAALCAGVIAGDAQALLEVIAGVTPAQKEEIKTYMDQVKLKITPASSGHVFEIDVTVSGRNGNARVRIIDNHTNIILVEKNGQPIFTKDVCSEEKETKTDHSVLNIEDIIDFANTVDVEDEFVVIGTKGRVTIPGDWWNTGYFEAKIDDSKGLKRYCFNFEGNGLRYLLQELLIMISDERTECTRLFNEESETLADILEIINQRG